MWRSGRESNPRIRVLQTLALPLGYRTHEYKLYHEILSVPFSNRCIKSML